MDATVSYLDQLTACGLLLPTGVDGVYGRSEVFERVLDGICDLVGRAGADAGPEVLRFPPGMRLGDLTQSGYLKSFPHFAGTVHCFCGNERDHAKLLRCVEAGEDWTEGQKATEVVLTPAACYPVYPIMARRGNLPPEGRLIDVTSYCFRHEPSLDPARMQMFRIREYVRMGTPEQVSSFREAWLDHGQKVIASLGLPHKLDLANDPFFGRAGRVLADSQRGQQLKFELLIPINSEEKPTACVSFNYHMDHFGQVWNLRTDRDAVAHTGCVGFGLERIALAMFRHHGFDPDKWPAGVRAALWPGR